LLGIRPALEYAFGYTNWNILSAKIEAAEPGGGAQKPTRPKSLYCIFCGKSQHEVKRLIAGPSAYICDEWVELCMDIIHGQNLQPIKTGRGER
jgi:hypothetical protein